MNCSQCQAEIPDDSRFCEMCGAALRTDSPKPPEPHAPVSVPTPVAAADSESAPPAAMPASPAVPVTASEPHAAAAPAAPPPPFAPTPPAPVPHPEPKTGAPTAGMRLLLPVGRSGWAIAAGYLGLFSILLVPGPFALVAGIIAVVDIVRHPGKHGLGRAIFGIVMGAIGTLIWVATGSHFFY